MTKYPHCRDYVIRDGHLVGEFEAMYQDFDDPWNQATAERWASDKAIGLNLIGRLQEGFGIRRVVEIGCGLGGYTRRLRSLGLSTIGLDVSPTAIEKARAADPDGSYEVAAIDDHAVLERLAPDVVVMAEVSWYVLDRLRPFLGFIEARLPEAWLFHTLTLYPDDKQQYGRDFFTTEEGIRRFFGLNYLEWGEVCSINGARRAYFLGTWRSGRLGLPD